VDNHNQTIDFLRTARGTNGLPSAFSPRQSTATVSPRKSPWQD